MIMKIIEPNSDLEMIKALQTSAEPLDNIYTKHKSYCINFMRKMNAVDEETLLDIYQDAIIVLYEKSQNIDFTLTCSIQKYLNSICRNQVLVRIGSKSKVINQDISDSEFDEDIVDWLNDNEVIEDNKFKSVTIAMTKLKELGGRCHEILKRFWYQNQTIEQIAYEMDYSNDDNVKNQKARCQKKLKELAFVEFNNNK